MENDRPIINLNINHIIGEIHLTPEGVYFRPGEFQFVETSRCPDSLDLLRLNAVLLDNLRGVLEKSLRELDLLDSH